MSNPLPVPGPEVTTPTPTPTPAAPAAPVVETPTPEPETDWKAKSREWEARAKANKDAADRLAALEQEQMTEAQRQAAATAAAVQAAKDAQDEATRYRVAATHGITAEFFDLLGAGDEATVTERATLLKPLIGAVAENVSLKSELVQAKADIEALKAGRPLSARPVADLKPGATPDNTPSEEDVLYNSLFGLPSS